MAKDCVFKVKASKQLSGDTNRFVEISRDGDTVAAFWLTMGEWSAFRSGLMPNSHVDFIIEEEEDGTTKRG